MRSKDIKMLSMLGMFTAMYKPQDNLFIYDEPKSKAGGIPDKPNKVIPKGCKEYTFSGIKVIASSEKSARKKIQKRLKHETTQRT